MYRRIDVSSLVKPLQPGTVYAYVGDEQADRDDERVPNEYMKTIDEGFEYWGQGFKEEFLRRTTPHTLSDISGPYRFPRAAKAEITQSGRL